MTQPNDPPATDPVPTPPATPPAGDPPKPGEGQPPSRTFTQEDLNRVEANAKREYRLKREADEELIELGRSAKEALDAQRPLEERVATLTGEKSTIEAERDTLRTENKRMKLAATAKLDPLLWDRVRGDTDEEILADIETLRPLAAQGTPPAGGGAAPQGPQPNPQQGNPSPNDGKTGSIAGGRDLYAQRHGKKTENAAT